MISTNSKGNVDRCQDQYKKFSAGVKRKKFHKVPDLYAKKVGGNVELACKVRLTGYQPAAKLLEVYKPTQDGGNSRKKRGRKPAPRPRGAKLSPSQVPAMDDVLLSGSMTYGMVKSLAKAIDKHRSTLQGSGDALYEPDVLYRIPDFRVLTALRYVTYLGEAYGVQTDLKEVLSLPLGASEITLEEATLLYEGLLSGAASLSADDALGPGLLIAEIRSRTGEVLYQAEVRSSRVAAEGVGDMTADILRNVVLYGTGKRAREVVTASGAAVPLGGKTGTTNDFRNAAFLGYIPGAAAEGGYRALDGHVVGSYVGYDDNREMKAGNLRVSGAVGALPPWIAAVQGIDKWDPEKPGGSPGSNGWSLAHAPGLTRRTIEGGATALSDARSPGGTRPGTRVITRRNGAPATPRPHRTPTRGGKGKTKKKPFWQFW